MRVHILVAAILLAALSQACSRKGDNVTLPRCTKFSECIQHDGKRVELVGTYTLYYVPRPQAHKAKRPVVRIQLEDKAVFLAPLWSKQVRRDQSEMDRFAGKRVRVRGVFNKYIPHAPGDPPQAVKFMQPAMFPIESITEDPAE